MITVTDHLLQTAPGFDDAFRHGVDLALAGVKPRGDYWLFAEVRGRHGFAAIPAPLLTPPNANAKLAKGVAPSYGLTLQHFRIVLDAVVDVDGAEIWPRLSLNACPNAGHCVRVCVLDNGHGQDPMVQRARDSRVDLLARHPESFARILAFELVRAVRKHGEILFRPDVNSNVEWQRVCPSLTDGYLAGIMLYGYSKIPSVLDGNGWLGAVYRVAYSWNETSDPVAVSAFIARGGSVAAVTSRATGADVVRAMPFDYGSAPVVDADLTDEWILTPGATIGDLSAKGRARKLIGHSGFVVVPLTARKRALLTVRAA